MEVAALKLKAQVAQLQVYGVSSRVAFMNDDPLSCLPEYFDPWWTIASRLPELVQDGTLRCEVIKMPCLDFRRLNSEPEWRLAHVLLCAITQCYVWMAGDDNIPQCIPECLAVPYWEVSNALGVVPCCSELSTVQENWRLVDPAEPMTADNMTPIVHLPGGEDQAWFFMVTGQVEKDGAPALSGIVEAQQAVKDLNVETYILALEEVAKALKKMRESLSRMRERCRPWAFYNILRPYLAGWNSPAFRAKGWKGLIYEGVSSEPISVNSEGEVLAKVPYCSAWTQPLEFIISRQRNVCKDYQRRMLPLYRKFIQALADGPSIRHFATFCRDPRAVEVYKECLQGLAGFRSAHMALVTEYIIVPSRKNAGVDISNKKEAPTGLATGKPGFLEFLKALRRSVLAAFYPVDSGTGEK